MKNNFRTRSEARIFCKLHGIPAKDIVGPTGDSLPWHVSYEEHAFVIGKTYELLNKETEGYRVGLISVDESILCTAKLGQYFQFSGTKTGNQVQIHESNASRFVVVKADEAAIKKASDLAEWRCIRDEFYKIDKSIEEFATSIHKAQLNIEHANIRKKSLYLRIENMLLGK